MPDDASRAGALAHVERFGAGSPLVCLHGGGGLTTALPFFRRLGDRFDVIAIRQPGFDGSPAPDWLESIQDVALFHLETLDALGIGKAHVLGLSLGGWVGMEMGVLAPERLASLTLVGAPGLTVEAAPPADNFLWDEEARVRRMVHDQDLAGRMLAAMAAKAGDEEAQAAAIGAWTALARLAWSPRWVSPRLDKWAGRLRMPAHVIWGAEDQLFPVAYVDHYAAALPDAATTVLPDCGHLVHAEKPEALLAATLSFLDACDAKEAAA